MTETKKRTKKEAREAKERAALCAEEAFKLALASVHPVMKEAVAKLRVDFYADMGLKMPEQG